MNHPISEQTFRRIYHRVRYRGIRELDLWLGGFFSSFGREFSMRELSVFEDLLEIEDQALLAMLMGRQALHLPEEVADMVRRVQTSPPGAEILRHVDV